MYKLIFDSTPDGLLVVDRTGHITDFNSQVITMFGYQREELLGQAIELLVPDSIAKTHNQFRDNYLKSPSRRPMGVNSELFARRMNGSIFPVDIQLGPIGDGDQSSILCVVRDITEGKQAEKKFRSLLESAPDAMVIVDSLGNIVLVNSQAENLFGYCREEILSKPVEVLIPERFRGVHRGFRNDYFGSAKVRPMGADLDLYGLRKDGSEISIELSLSPIETAEGVLVSAAIRDVTARRKAEKIIENSLLEKELMLKEIHHRVKNNLAVIGSLFYLQSTYTNSEALKSVLLESQNRVRSMAMVHEGLYRADNFKEINFSEYVSDMASSLISTYSFSENKTNLELDLHNVYLDIETAVPCGLILNEIITNALKHAFKSNTALACITITIRITVDNSVIISVKDNGVGLPADFDFNSSNTLGIRLIVLLPAK